MGDAVNNVHTRNPYINIYTSDINENLLDIKKLFYDNDYFELVLFNKLQRSLNELDDLRQRYEQTNQKDIFIDILSKYRDKLTELIN